MTMAKTCGKFFTLTLLAAMLTGCGALRSYHQELATPMAALHRGEAALALALLEKNNQGADKDLLYYLEKGAVARLTGNLAASNESWLQADETIRQWEEAVQGDGTKAAGALGSLLLNDRTRSYEGYDYEKVMLSTELALNHLLNGDLDKARVEIKKTHEREAVIAELRAREVADIAAESDRQGVHHSYRELNGYPVAVLDDPQVTQLKNSYQSAFSHYLAGFLYEALGEPGLAAPGYRQAIELRPDTPILEQGLADLESRLSPKKTRDKKGTPPRETGTATDTLFIVESGVTPPRQSFSVHLPVPVGHGVILGSFTVPLIRPGAPLPPGEITLADGPTLPLTTITSIDAMSRRALRDDMPGILLRNVLRLAAKGAMQKSLQDRNGVLGLVAALASLATEGADERTWRTLPAEVAIGRAHLPRGHHRLTLGPFQKSLHIDGQHQVVLLRVIGNTLYRVETSLGPATSAP